ncbi:MAG: CPBP family intramembrane metalloprotease [bacterium]|nr:CPBP family intramembrane metalloprotease [bacterium]
MSGARGVSAVLFEVTAATVAAGLAIRALVAGPTWLGILYPAVWIYLPLAVLLGRRLPLAPFGFRIAAWTRGGRWLVGSLVFVLLPFAAAVAVWKSAAGGLDLTLHRWAAGTVVSHLLFAAVPEELFFRGYVQERLRSSCGEWGSILLAALLFALAHLLVEPGWLRAAVFFPGLVMGWLRERSGGLLAPALFHWLSNLTAGLLVL